MKKHSARWLNSWIKFLLGLASLFIIQQSSSYADDCIKLVAHKYCLGGSFANAMELYKKYPRFTKDIVKIDRILLNQIGFIDYDVLDMDKVMVIFDELEGKIVSIKFVPVLDGENDNGYMKAMKVLHDKYCLNKRSFRREKTLVCPAGDFAVFIAIAKVQDNGETLNIPTFGYGSPELVLKATDKGY